MRAVIPPDNERHFLPLFAVRADLAAGEVLASLDEVFSTFLDLVFEAVQKRSPPCIGDRPGESLGTILEEGGDVEALDAEDVVVFDHLGGELLDKIVS